MRRERLIAKGRDEPKAENVFDQAEGDKVSDCFLWAVRSVRTGIRWALCCSAAFSRAMLHTHSRRCF